MPDKDFEKQLEKEIENTFSEALREINFTPFFEDLYRKKKEKFEKDNS